MPAPRKPLSPHPASRGTYTPRHCPRHTRAPSLPQTHEHSIIAPDLQAPHYCPRAWPPGSITLHAAATAAMREDMFQRTLPHSVSCFYLPSQVSSLTEGLVSSHAHVPSQGAPAPANARQQRVQAPAPAKRPCCSLDKSHLNPKNFSCSVTLSTQPHAAPHHTTSSSQPLSSPARWWPHRRAAPWAAPAAHAQWPGAAAGRRSAPPPWAR